MVNESQQKPKPRRQHNTHKKDRMKTNAVQIEIEKGKEEKKKNVDINNARRDITQGQYAYLRLARSAGAISGE